MEPYYSAVPPNRSPPPAYHYSKQLKQADESSCHFRFLLIVYSAACFTICCSTTPLIPFLVGDPSLIVINLLVGIVINGLLFGGAVGRDLPILKISKIFTFIMIILLSISVLILINATVGFLVLKDREHIKLYMDEYYPTYSQSSIKNAFILMWIFSVLAAIDLLIRDYLISNTIREIREGNLKRMTV